MKLIKTVLVGISILYTTISMATTNIGSNIEVTDYIAYGDMYEWTLSDGYHTDGHSKIYADKKMTFSGNVWIDGENVIFESPSIVFNNLNAVDGIGIANGSMTLENTIAEFDYAKWEIPYKGKIAFSGNSAIKLGENSWGKTLIQSNNLNGDVRFVVDNKSIAENSSEQMCLSADDANGFENFSVKENTLYAIEDNGATTRERQYTITQRDINEIAEKGNYSEEQATLLKAMMQVSGNSLFDTVSTMVQMGEDASDLLDGLRPATAAAQSAAFDTTISTIRAIYNHITPTHDPLVYQKIKERTHITPWVEGMYTHTKNEMGKQGFVSNQTGFAMGVDANITDKALIGAGYSQTTGSFDAEIGGKTDLDGYTGFIYGSWKPTQLFIAGMAAYSKMKYNNSGIEWNADVFGGQGAIGYEWGWIDVGVGARYIKVKSEDYKNAYGTDIKTKDSDMATGIAGVHAQKVFKDEKGWMLVPSAHVAATYDFKEADDETSIFYNGTKLYTYKGEKPERFGVEAGVGLRLQKGRMELQLTYDGAFRKDIYSNSGFATLKYHF